MTVTALAIAVDLPENQLESILEVLTEAGLVRHYSDVASLNASTHTWRSHYQLVKPWRTSVTTDPARLLPRQRHGFT